MSQKIKDLNTILDSLSTFYKQNLGTLSNAIWNAQDELELRNSDVVAIINSLATAKEHVDNNISAIKEAVAGKGENPE